MNHSAIRVSGLSKQYRIGAHQESYQTLRDSIAGAFTSPVQKMRNMFRGSRTRSQAETFWALHGITFDVERGDVIGVIGRNGAGKSTLLKILSRITAPSEGSADIYGRVGSLLEVGTGFHAELSGRENVFLNGAILGMRRAEIERKFDEIVAFSEIDKFIDTPVKHYSTGMYMRLAFAVAAHLEPEILLVDEVLSVGDAAFQKKCLGKMGEVARQGRTVLFVSHNMPTVQSLCRKSLVLDQGRIGYYGDVLEGVRLYHQSFQNRHTEVRGGAEVAVGCPMVNGMEAPEVSSAAPLVFSFEISVQRPLSAFRMFLLLEAAQGAIALHAASDDTSLPSLKQPGHHAVTMRCPALHLTPGVYSVHAKMICSGVGIQGRYLSDRIMMSVTGAYDPGMIAGLLMPPLEWEVS